MAFQRADPAPFLPDHLEVQDVPNRRFMTRAVAPVRPLARNENLAIVTIDPIPGNPMHFAAVRGVLRDFLREEVRMPYLDIQPTSLGQAMVRLKYAHARDALVQDSPHVFDNVLVTFTKHDRGRNWRAADFNHECWLLLLDFPRDYLSERHIYQAVGDFAKVLLVQLEEGSESSLLIRAKVKDVEQVPQYVVLEDPDTIGGESFTIQCEVLRQKQPYEEPPPQDPVPDNNVIEQALPFDFIGLGQPVHNPGNQLQGQGQAGWDAWPEEDQDVNRDLEEAEEILEDIQLAQQNIGIFEQHGIGGNADMAEGLDLNQPPMDQDLDPVIINPVENDPFGHGEQIQYLLQEQGEVYQNNPVVQVEVHELGVGIGAMAQEVVEAPPEAVQAPAEIPQQNQQGPPLNFLVEEFSPEQLMNSEDLLENQSQEEEENNLGSQQNSSRGNSRQNQTSRGDTRQNQIQINGPPAQDVQQDGWADHLNQSKAQETFQALEQAVGPMEIENHQRMSGQEGSQKSHDSNNHLQITNNEIDLLNNFNQINQALIPDENQVLEAMVADNFHQEQSIQIGLTLTRMEDNQMAWSQATNAEATRLSTRFFSSGNPANLQVSIPATWVNFFTAQLLDPNNFDWIRNILASGLIGHLDSADSGIVDFSVPTSRLEFNLSCLTDSLGKGQETSQEYAKEAPPKKRYNKRTAAVVETEVRRSPRIKSSNKGFRSEGCKEKNCFACRVKPPTLKKENIRKIAIQFCNLDDYEICDDSLQGKRKKAYPVARARITLAEVEVRKSTEEVEEEAADNAGKEVQSTHQTNEAKE